VSENVAYANLVKDIFQHQLRALADTSGKFDDDRDYPDSDTEDGPAGIVIIIIIIIIIIVVVVVVVVIVLDCDEVV
jgi:hypothetical protein